MPPKKVELKSTTHSAVELSVEGDAEQYKKRLSDPSAQSQ